MRVSTTMTIERDGVEVIVEVTGDYHGPMRGSRDHYGAPEEPDDEPEVIFLSAWIGCDEFTLTDEDQKRAEEILLASLGVRA